MFVAGGSSKVPSLTETYETQARQYVARISTQNGYRPASGEREIAAAIEKDQFCREFRVREFQWSAHNLARLLNRTGEDPERVEASGVPASFRPRREDRSPSAEQIVLHAYHLWLARGQPVGTDWDDWLEAERQLAASA